MFTVVGPVIAIWLMGVRYAELQPRMAASTGAQLALLAAYVAVACSVLYGVYAGLRLWQVRPNAVKTAKTALLLALAADIFSTVVEVLARHSPGDDGSLIYQTLGHCFPSLIFFTLCFAYLQRSRRVYATFPTDA